MFPWRNVGIIRSVRIIDVPADNVYVTLDPFLHSTVIESTSGATVYDLRGIYVVTHGDVVGITTSPSIGFNIRDAVLVISKSPESFTLGNVLPQSTRFMIPLPTSKPTRSASSWFVKTSKPTSAVNWRVASTFADGVYFRPDVYMHARELYPDCHVAYMSSSIDELPTRYIGVACGHEERHAYIHGSHLVYIYRYMDDMYASILPIDVMRTWSISPSEWPVPNAFDKYIYTRWVP